MVELTYITTIQKALLSMCFTSANPPKGGGAKLQSLFHMDGRQLHKRDAVLMRGGVF